MKSIKESEAAKLPDGWTGESPESSAEREQRLLREQVEDLKDQVAFAELNRRVEPNEGEP